MGGFLIDLIVWLGLEPLLRKMGLFSDFEAGEARFDSKTGKRIK